MCFSTAEWQQRQAKLSERWCDVREKLAKVLGNHFAPNIYTCIMCSKREINIIRCSDCGPEAYYCDVCCEVAHKHITLHIPEKWQVCTHGSVFINEPFSL